MAEQTENKTVDFDDQMKAERDFYLGKTEKIPGSDLSLGDAKSAHATTISDFEKTRAKRAENVRKRNQARQSELVKSGVVAGTSTSIVTPGVNVEIKRELPVPSEQAAQVLPALPSDADLAKMDTEALIVLAGERKVDVKANVDTKPAMIAKLKGEYTDAKFASLSGKGREALDGFAIELGLGANSDDLKEKFPNIETLSTAIEKAREN